MNTVLKQINEIIVEEIKYISSLFPYNVRQFYNPGLIYSRNILSFINYQSINSGNSYIFSDSFQKKIINLLAGIELLAIGINLHSFNANDFMALAGDEKHQAKDDKSYTLDLLFGDILYSRASVYLLEYGDHLVFESIMDSLKLAHGSKLILHQKIIRAINTVQDRNFSKGISAGIPDDSLQKYEMEIKALFDENTNLILGINSLLKTSFIIGSGLFLTEDNAKVPFRLICNFVLLKAYNDLDLFFESLPDNFHGKKQIKVFISNKKNFIKKELNDTISNLGLEWLKFNFKTLEKFYL